MSAPDDRRTFKTPFGDVEERRRAGRFGMLLFLASLAVLFAATVVGFLIIRIQLSQRGLWPQELPALPNGLWLATIVILVSSATMHLAVKAGRTAGHTSAVRRNLIVTLALGAAFLVIQTLCWVAWLAVVREHWDRSEEWRFALTGFYILSGLHAVHVFGGLAALAYAADKITALDPARCRRLVDGGAMYWHFLAGVWVVLFVLLRF